MEDTIIKFISNVGVPAGIAFFILMRLETALNKMVDALNNLEDKIEASNTKMTEALGRQSKALLLLCSRNSNKDLVNSIINNGEVKADV